MCEYSAAEPDAKIGQGISFIVGGIGNALLLYISLFGKHVGLRAVRWHAANFSAWNIFFLLVRASYGDWTPWCNYITDPLIKQYSEDIQLFCLTVFFATLPWVFVDAFLAFLSPRLASSRISSAIFAFLIIIFTNAGMIKVFLDTENGAQYEDYDYSPFFYFHGILVTVHAVLFLVALLTAVAVSVIGCLTRRHCRRSASAFYHVWISWLYGFAAYVPFLIASSLILFGTSMNIGQDLTGLLTKAAMGIYNSIQNAQKPTPGEGGTGGDGGGDGGDGGGGIDLNTLLMQMINLLISLVNWTNVGIPLCECIATLVLFVGYQKQMLLLLSCGYICSTQGKTDEKGKQTLGKGFWARRTLKLSGRVSEVTTVTTITSVDQKEKPAATY